MLPNSITGLDLLKIIDEWTLVNNQLRKYNIKDLAFVSFISDPVVANSLAPIVFYDQRICVPMYSSLKGSDDETSYDLITVSPSVIVAPNKPFMSDYIFGRSQPDYQAGAQLYSPSLLKTRNENGFIASIDTSSRSKIQLKTALGFPSIDSEFLFDVELPRMIPLFSFAPVQVSWARQSSKDLLMKLWKTPQSFEFSLSGKEVYDQLDTAIQLSGVMVYPDMVKQKPDTITAYREHSDGITSICLQLVFKNTIHYVFYAYFEAIDNG